ncbi:MAG: type II toxin-antitoxin system HicA family toxin [Ruminococcaceae bacterium]|nr:type II toxin-antitoxin system HicA family toxin [Oscillospiraceae bacterium]
MPKKAKEIERIILDDGWYCYTQKGSHRQYKHKTKPGKVTIPFHGGQDIDPRTEKSILKQAQIVETK